MGDGFLPMMQPVFSQIDMEETPAASDLRSSLNANNDEDINISVLIVMVGLLLFLFFYFLIDCFHNLLQNEMDESDIEVGEMSNQRRPWRTISAVDWSHQAAAIYERNLWVLETLNRFVQALDERRGLRREELEKVLPIVNYNSNEMKRSDDCAICLEDFEDEDLCRIFPVCNHVFHWNCIDGWVKNNLTCPVCRSCILVLDDLDSL